jgi:hypothetical protein
LKPAENQPKPPKSSRHRTTRACRHHCGRQFSNSLLAWHGHTVEGMVARFDDISFRCPVRDRLPGSIAMQRGWSLLMDVLGADLMQPTCS